MGGAAIVAGGGTGLDLVRSLAQEKNPPDFFMLDGVAKEDGGALCISFRATMEGVSRPERRRVLSLGSESVDSMLGSWYTPKKDGLGGEGGRSCPDSETTLDICTRGGLSLREKTLGEVPETCG